MNMWNWLTPANLITMQRKAALGYMGEQARMLLKDGYAYEADRILDEINERKRGWDLQDEACIKGTAT